MEQVTAVEICAVCGKVFPAGWCSIAYDEVTGEPFFVSPDCDIPDTLTSQS